MPWINPPTSGPWHAALFEKTEAGGLSVLSRMVWRLRCEDFRAMSDRSGRSLIANGDRDPDDLRSPPCRCNSHCPARIPAVRCGAMTACLPWRFRWEDRFFETPCSGHSSAQESIYTCRIWSSRKRRSSFKCKQCVPKVQKLHFELHFGRTRGTSSDCR